MRIPHTPLLRLLALAILTLAALPTTVEAASGSLVPFRDLRPQDQKDADPTDEANGNAILELFKEQYGRRDAKMDDIDVDAFRTYQAAISELHMNIAAHDEAEKNFNKLVRDNEERPDLYYTSSWASNQTTMFDNSGQVRASRKGMTDPRLGMMDKSMYFPPQETIDKIVQISREKNEIISKLPNPLDPDAFNQFLSQKEEFEKRFLTVIAKDIAQMVELAGRTDVYGLGHIERPDGTREPLRLDFEHLRRFMTERGITIPSPAAGPTAAGTDPDAQIQTVRQSPEVERSTNEAYDAFVRGFASESDRTKAEILNDQFRFRIRPRDLRPGEGQKCYDPYMTYELQPGALNLPSANPEE